MGATVSAVAALDLELQGLSEALRRAETIVEKDMHSALKRIGTMVANRAKAVHEYTDRTGLLTQSIEPAEPTGTLAGGDKAVDVLAGSESLHYAGYIEHGTKRGIRPYLYMTNAAQFVADNDAVLILQDTLANALEKALGSSTP